MSLCDPDYDEFTDNDGDEFEDDDEYSIFDDPCPDSPALDPPWWAYR